MKRLLKKVTRLDSGKVLSKDFFIESLMEKV